MGEEATPEFDVDAVGGVRQDVGPQERQHGVEEPDGDEADGEHVERRVALVGQHLVDDHLEEQRRDEAEDLQEQRGDQHVAERPAVSPQRGQEPPESEGFRVRTLAAESPRQQDGGAGRSGEQLHRREVLVGFGDGVDEAVALDAGGVVGARRQHGEAGRRRQDGRERHRRQAFGVERPDRPRAQAEDPRAALDVGRRGAAADQAELALERGLVVGDPVVAGDREEAEDRAGVGRADIVFAMNRRLALCHVPRVAIRSPRSLHDGVAGGTCAAVFAVEE